MVRFHAPVEDTVFQDREIDKSPGRPEKELSGASTDRQSRLELRDFHVAVAGVDGQWRAPAIQLPVQRVPVPATGLEVFDGER